MIGLVSVQSGDQAERQYFHFARAFALRRIAGYGPKDPGPILEKVKEQHGGTDALNDLPTSAILSCSDLKEYIGDKDKPRDWRGKRVLFSTMGGTADQFARWIAGAPSPSREAGFDAQLKELEDAELEKVFKEQV